MSVGLSGGEGGAGLFLDVVVVDALVEGTGLLGTNAGDSTERVPLVAVVILVSDGTGESCWEGRFDSAQQTLSSAQPSLSRIQNIPIQL